jgi:hypothetical protein
MVLHRASFGFGSRGYGKTTVLVEEMRRREADGHEVTRVGACFSCGAVGPLYTVTGVHGGLGQCRECADDYARTLNEEG